MIEVMISFYLSLTTKRHLVLWSTLIQKHDCCCIKRYMMLNYLCLLFLPNISLVIWTARLWMQPISDWVEYCLILKVFLIKFHLYFWANFQNIFCVFFSISLWNTHIPFPTRLSVNISFIGYFLFVLVTLHENVCLNFVLFACLICCSLVFL